MSVPKLRFNEFTQLPREATFKEVVESNVYGPRFNANDYDLNGNVKTIRGTDVSLDGEILYSQVPTAKLDELFIKSHLLKAGDLVMITTADCGLTGVFRAQHESYIASAYAVKITLNDKADPYYFKYFFQTTFAINQINSFVRKGTVANLPCSDILRCKLFLFDKSEQTKIANFLTAVDEKITQLTHKCDLLAQYKKGVMQQIFSQQLRFKDDDGKDFPEWEERTLSDIAQIVGGGTPDTAIKDYWKGDIQWFTPTELKTKYTSNSLRTISESGLKNSSAKLLPVGTLLFSSRATVGDISIAVNECTTNQGFQSLIVNEKNNNEFIYYWILNNKRAFLEKASGSTFLEISKKEIEKLTIQSPDKKEQTKIANFLAAIDDKITNTQAQLAAVKQYKQGLLQQMFV